jgi:DDHD domain
MYLLNDNGQIDWYLQGGGGLENQYLNMLGAHSSYWESRDFVRFLVCEVGRVPGKGGLLTVRRKGVLR